MANVNLTFVDDDGNLNPFSPIREFNEWFSWNPSRAAKCCSMVAAIAEVSESTPESEQDQALEDAIDEICRENVTGYFRKYIE